MSTNELHKATVMTLALVIERLFNSLNANNLNDALLHVVQVERGAQLLADSFAQELGLDKRDIDNMRDELENALKDGATPELDVMSLRLPSKPDNPSLN